MWAGSCGALHLLPAAFNKACRSYLRHVLSPAVRTGVVQRPKDKLLTMDPKEITYEMVQKKLQEIAMARGKTTRIDRQEQVGTVQPEMEVASSSAPGFDLVHLHLVLFTDV